MKKKKSSKKKAAVKKPKKSLVRGKVTLSASKRSVVTKQPQSKMQAAVSSGMFLYTDDAWSLRYFDENDLHCREREFLG